MLLLSIHPRHVKAILSGDKRVELRRRRPRISQGEALIYSTAPQMELVATFQIQSVARQPLKLLWQSVRDIAGISRQQFDDYFCGVDAGVSIRIADVKELRRPISLNELRDAWPGFQPPQGFLYLDHAEIARLGIGIFRNAA